MKGKAFKYLCTTLFKTFKIKYELKISKGEEIMANFIVKSELKKYVLSKGKRQSPSFCAWLNRKVMMIIDEQIMALGGKVKTLNGNNCEEVYAIKKTLKIKRRRI